MALVGALTLVGAVTLVGALTLVGAVTLVGALTSCHGGSMSRTTGSTRHLTRLLCAGVDESGGAEAVWLPCHGPLSFISLTMHTHIYLEELKLSGFRVTVLSLSSLSLCTHTSILRS